MEIEIVTVADIINQRDAVLEEIQMLIHKIHKLNLRYYGKLARARKKLMQLDSRLN